MWIHQERWQSADFDYEFIRDDFTMNNLMFMAQDNKGLTHVIKAKGEDFV